MSDAPHHLETLRLEVVYFTTLRDAAEKGSSDHEHGPAFWAAKIDALAYAIRAIEERDELLKLVREVEAYGVPRFNQAIRDLIAKAEWTDA